MEGSTQRRVSYQGEPGSNSDQACHEALPGYRPLPSATFDVAIDAVAQDRADVALIPVENSIAGRVADVHRLLPDSGLSIIGEHFMPIHFCLLAPPGASIENITHVRSHLHALGQCRKLIEQHSLTPLVADDTAGAAREVAESGDLSHAALAPHAAADIYGLSVLAKNVEDEHHNTTRFLVLSPTPLAPADTGSPMITTLVFRVRNVPSALFKALGGFATNGVNMTKLESYQQNGTFLATGFYADFEGHPDNPAVKRALEELEYFCVDLRILGVYPAHDFRRTTNPEVFFEK